MEKKGTLTYAAPEIYCGTSRGAGTAADSWSLGAVLYVLLVGASPFRWVAGDSNELIMQRIREGNVNRQRTSWNRLSSEGRNLIECLLHVDENGRASCEKAWCHRWLASITRTQQDHLESAALQVHALLLRFAQLDAFQRLLLTVCSRVISEDSLGCAHPDMPWREVFLSLDVDRDGCLGIDELADGLRSLLPAVFLVQKASHAPPLKELVLALDVDGSGFIEWAEWLALALLAEGRLAERDEVLQAAFRLLDAPSADGIICPKDLAVLFNIGAGGPSEACYEVSSNLLLRWAVSWRRDFGSQPVLDFEEMRRVIQVAMVEGLAKEDTGLPAESSLIAEERYINALSRSRAFKGTVKMEQES
eukprot:gnl/TRDRNA2_/TRDRNA2_172589_c1_seq1.p1 gnl/TRDRNA2_/TRDRNA2_172589_c1~~gnl/TRDRNA2_/TRDRNA2_172589_c1_seq1.p1  ORF type:complete len:362 (+),score=54.30 gnl/TRDRNA2_/TRDRNA2_172589_c1_seq1:22-1107(+)